MKKILKFLKSLNEEQIKRLVEDELFVDEFINNKFEYEKHKALMQNVLTLLGFLTPKNFDSLIKFLDDKKPKRVKAKKLKKPKTKKYQTKLTYEQRQQFQKIMEHEHV